jgi:hypothetical protein
MFLSRQTRKQQQALSTNAKGWLPWLLVPMSRHQQQRGDFSEPKPTKPPPKA